MSIRRLSASSIILASLCLASVLLVARSYFYSDQFTYKYPHSNSYMTLRMEGGSFFFFIQSNWAPRFNFATGFSSQYDDMGWSRLSVATLVDFRWRDNFFPGAGRRLLVVVPTWTTFAACLPIAGWIYFHRRPQIRWAFRPSISWCDPRLRARLARFAILCATGCVLGVIIGWADNRFYFSQNEHQWSLVLFALLPVVSLAAVFTRRRIPWHKAVLWLFLDLAGCICFLNATIDKMWTHFHLHIRSGGDLLDSILFLGLICFIFGAILLLFLQVKPEPNKPGPYCPECGYCLIGSTRKICTECGRPFTLEELGVSAGELIPTRTVSAG
jgi:hypothetical protein